MKRFLFAAVAAAGLMTAATSASAQTATGTVNITGTVAAKCAVISGGPTGGTTFGTTVALGELADPDGTLRNDLDTATASSNLVSANFRLNCTGANNTVTIDANPLATATNAPGGYANTIHFTGRVSINTVGGAAVSPFVLENDTTEVAADSAPLGPNVRLANAADNINIRAYAFGTTPNGDELLVAANNYAGSVVVTITPGT